MKIFSLLLVYLVSFNILANDINSNGVYTPCDKYDIPTGNRPEGISIGYTFKIKLRPLMGEPVIDATLKYHHVIKPKICYIGYDGKGYHIQEHSSIDWVTGNPKPYNVDMYVRIYSNNYNGNNPIYFKANMGVLDEHVGTFSFNTPSSPNWDKLFFTYDNTNTRGLFDESNHIYLSASEAKSIFNGKIDYAEHHIAKMDFNLNDYKKFSTKAKTKNYQYHFRQNIEEFLRRIRGNFGKIPPRLMAKIERAKTMELYESIKELIRIYEALVTKPLPDFFEADEAGKKKFKELQKQYTVYLNKYKAKFKDVPQSQDQLDFFYQQRKEELKSKYTEVRRQMRSRRDPLTHYNDLKSDFLSLTLPIVRKNGYRFTNEIEFHDSCLISIERTIEGGGSLERFTIDYVDITKPYVVYFKDHRITLDFVKNDAVDVYRRNGNGSIARNKFRYISFDYDSLETYKEASKIFGKLRSLCRYR